MGLALFSDYRWTRQKDHERYRESILAPVAPEWATGEVLLSGAYRTLILGVPESRVDRRDIARLPSSLPHTHVWSELLTHRSGFHSPPSKKETLGLPQLMPYVPEIARYAGVLGQPRSRWDPGNLLLTALGSGWHPSQFDAETSRLTLALEVHDSDDVFARFTENTLRQVAEDRQVDTPKARRPAWRENTAALLTPAERFARDISSISGLKQRLTRRQWTAAVEALMRIGLAAHVLWLCKLNVKVWDVATAALEGQCISGAQALEDSCWLAHHGEPLLALGLNGIPMIKQAIQAYVGARIGLSLVLHALDDAGASWDEQIGSTPPPSQAVHRFAEHLVRNASNVNRVVGEHFEGASVIAAAAAVTDANQALAKGEDGFAKNVAEFIRYSLSQLQSRDPELQSYDQSYVLHKQTKSNNSPWPVQPGPTTLIVLVSVCCRSAGSVPSSIDDLKLHLANYGVHASAGELQDGTISRHLKLLGLVIDSPDAAGGRLLVDPFGP